MLHQMRRYAGQVLSGRQLHTEVSVIGCGCPGRGMGWYHAKQILDGDVPSASLTDVVEPWYMGKGVGTPGSSEFEEFKKSAESQGVRFHAAVADLPKPEGKRLTVVSTRTVDMPGIVETLLKNELSSHIFLEKPGAPSVGELEKMKADAEAAGVPIYMGFNKNVTGYVQKALEAHAKLPGSEFALVHHNSYKKVELDECFERNAEGILKNMAIHELALLVTFFDCTVDKVVSVEAKKAYSSCETRKGPSSNKSYTDFSKIGFSVTTKDGQKLTVYADRCGGELPGGAMLDGAMMYAAVVKDDIVQCRAIAPDADLAALVKSRTEQAPDIMSYFHLQHDDYITLKERCCSHIAADAPGTPLGIADIRIAAETLKLAEHLKAALEVQLK